MLRRVSQLLIPLAILSSVSAFAQTQDLPRVGVLDLTSENVPPAEVRLLSDRLRVELFKTGQFTVLERQQMENILKEQGFQQSGCIATECVIEVGQLLGVEKMVAGSVGQVGAVYTISLRVINVGTGALERTATRDCRCTIEDILTTTIAQVAAELATYRFGRVRVISPSPGADGATVDLTALSIEELMGIEVTTVSRKAEKLSETAAAVYVVTADDIRRTGVTSIPDALRAVPGLDVAHIDANKWAISSRGFNGLFANKLLVQIDGRSVYTPLFSGVFWEAQDVLLEDVARIEVVRGPGATLWGANAVNGIINIVTERAQDTQGWLVATGTGTKERKFGSLRYGGRIGGSAFYRVYVKYFDRKADSRASDQPAADGWDVLRTGLRLDWALSRTTSLTVTGDLYRGTVGQTYSVIPDLEPPLREVFDATGRISGGHVLSRWTHSFAGGSEATVQVYVDRLCREERVFDGTLVTYDLDVQHRFPIGRRNELLWGVGYRLTRDRYQDTFTIRIDPLRRSTNLMSAFIQDEMKLLQRRLTLTLGTKFEHKSVVGYAIEPSLRLLWTPDNRNTVWAAVSRAVRTPSRVESDGQLVEDVVPDSLLPPGLPTGLAVLLGSTTYRSEELIAYELGYRLNAGDRTFLDVATFYNRYDNLRTLEPGLPFRRNDPSPYLVFPIRLENRMAATAFGWESFVEHRPTRRWVLRATYTYLALQEELDPSSSNLFGEQDERDIPNHQVSIRSSMALPWDLDLDVQGRYVGPLRASGVDRYLTADGRIGWHPRRNVEIAVVGKNLLGGSRYEYVPSYSAIVATKVERSVFASISWRL